MIDQFDIIHNTKHDRQQIDTGTLLAVSIICHDNPDLLDQCLSSLRSHRGTPPLRVIVTDNVNSAAVQRVARRHLTSVDILIVNAKPRGFAANHNTALARVTESFFLLLNDDTVVLPGALTAMSTCLAQDTRLGAVGCKMFANDRLDRVQDSCCTRFPSPRALLQNALVQNTGIRHLFPHTPFVRAWSSLAVNHDISQEAMHLNGACLLLRREALNQVGVLDERFFMFLEETDLCFRLKKAGWGIRYIADAAIIHYGGASADVSFRQQQFTQSLRLFLRKHYGHRGLACFCALFPLLWTLDKYYRVAKSIMDIMGRLRQRQKRSETS